MGRGNNGKAVLGKDFSILLLNVPLVTHLALLYSVFVLLASRTTKAERRDAIQEGQGKGLKNTVFHYLSLPKCLLETSGELNCC